MWSPEHLAGLQFRNSTLNFFLIRNWSAQNEGYDSLVVALKLRDIITEQSLDELLTQSRPESKIRAHTLSFSHTAEMIWRGFWTLFGWQPVACENRGSTRETGLVCMQHIVNIWCPRSVYLG